MSNNYRSGFSYIGEGVMWLLILLGIGSCCWLHDRNGKEPIVIIKHESQ